MPNFQKNTNFQLKNRRKMFNFGKSESSSEGKVVRKDLEDGVLGEANNNGEIVVDSKVEPGSKLDKQIQAHEKDHMKRMRSGELGYGDDWVRFRGKTYHRKDGKIKYQGKWLDEGDRSFPWEKLANKAIKNV